MAVRSRREVGITITAATDLLSARMRATRGRSRRQRAMRGRSGQAEGKSKRIRACELSEVESGSESFRTPIYSIGFITESTQKDQLFS